MKKIVLLIATICIMSCNSSDKNKQTFDYSAKDPNAGKSKEFVASIESGKKLYASFCITCHSTNGKGVPNAFPPLAQSDYLMNKRSASIKAIKYGQSGEIVVNGKTYNMPMTPMGLSDKEIADVMNYITNAWGNENLEPITAEEVSKIKP